LLIVEADIQLSTQFLTLIPVKDAEGNIDAETHGVFIKRIVKGRIIRIPDVKRRVG
jgi:hypothetical protein